jgi:hypothetical protein
MKTPPETTRALAAIIPSPSWNIRGKVPKMRPE